LLSVSVRALKGVAIGLNDPGGSDVATQLSTLSAAALLALAQPLVALAQPAQGPMGSQQGWDCPAHWHMWGGGFGLWWVLPTIVVMLLVLAVFFAGWRWMGIGPHHGGPAWHMADRTWGARPMGDPTYSALQVLNERFARGEIEKPEYEEKKAAILAAGHR
jgi:putative membrane protein